MGGELTIARHDRIHAEARCRRKGSSTHVDARTFRFTRQ
jgi:hypothetical protein